MDGRNKATPSWYTDGDKEAQKGGAAGPEAPSRPGAELASAQCDKADTRRARACVLKEMTGWSRPLPIFQRLLLPSEKVGKQSC